MSGTKQKFTDYEYLLRNISSNNQGNGTIDSEILKEWLKQDYLFAYEGGIKYTAALLSKISLSPSHSSIRPFPSSDLVPILGWSATNLLRETDWVLSVAKEHNLDVFQNRDLDKYGLLGEYSPITRGYIDYLQVIGALGSVEEGLMVLWASKKTHTHLNLSSNETQKALIAFVDNWTTPEFTEFVKRCENAMNKFEIEVGSEVADKCEKAFKAILWYEQRFWPSVEIK